MPAWFGQQRNRRLQIDVPVGDVEGNDPARSQMPPIKCEGLRGQQVQRYRIAGEGIHHQDVELLRRLRGERRSRISRNDRDLSARSPECR